jgi:DNA-binding transcriptional ArsR family regulator
MGHAMDAVKRLLWWLIAGSVGGVNRARIIQKLKERPCNANQLTEALKLDYKTVRHHIEVLEKNNLVTSTGQKYSKMYFLSALLEENFSSFSEIWAQIGKKDLKGKKDRGD